jgi:hypothetical protein
VPGKGKQANKSRQGRMNREIWFSSKPSSEIIAFIVGNLSCSCGLPMLKAPKARNSRSPVRSEALASQKPALKDKGGVGRFKEPHLAAAGWSAGAPACVMSA